MENYIVRIYRQGDRHSRNIVGVVETVGAEGREAFTNVDELWHILNPRAKRTRPASVKQGAGGDATGKPSDEKPGRRC